MVFSRTAPNTCIVPGSISDIFCHMKTLLRIIPAFLAPLTLLSALLAFFVPESFLPFGGVFRELFAATMFALGVVLDPSDLGTTLRQPQRIGLGVLTQYL